MNEVLLTSFMANVGFSAAEIFKMLLLVFMNFAFIGLLVFRGRKPLITLFSKLTAALDSVPKMEASIDRLNSTLQEHIVQTDLRITEGDERYLKVEAEIKKLKTHIGIK